MARRSYAKQVLHTDEAPYFAPGDGHLLLEVAGRTLAPAICFESLQPPHAEEAAGMGSEFYLASAAKPDGSMGRAVRHYPAIAREFGLTVVLANSVGPCDDFTSVGQSAAWDRHGELLAQMDRESEGIMLVDTDGGRASIPTAPRAVGGPELGRGPPP